MALAGKIEAEAEIKCSPEAMLHIFGGKAHGMPKLCGVRIPKIEVVEGDWGKHGSVRIWTYISGRRRKCRDIQRETHNRPERSTDFTGLEGDIMKFYKNYEGTLQIVERDGSNFARFTLYYEKLNDDVPAPHKYLSFLINFKKKQMPSFLAARN
ncbi:hypothetical protein NMG60_11018809 [Bertholletia excelsa]